MRTWITVLALALSALAGGTAHAQGASGCAPPHVAAMEQLMEDYVAVFNAHDMSQIGAVLADDYWTENPLGVFDGLPAMQAVMTSFIAAFPDLTYTIERVVVNGNQVVLEYSFTATHQGEIFGIPGTGRVVHGRGMEIHLVEDGKIAMTWNYSDVFRLLGQLGGL